MAENAIVPMNLMGRKPQPATADFIHTGSWTGKSIKEARKYGNVNIAASAETTGYTEVPARASWQLSKDAAYVHICSNETIDGVEYHFAPEVASDTGDAPIVADMSSQILSRVIDVSKYGVIFGGAQKNIGPAGLTIVIVREDLLGHALPCCPPPVSATFGCLFAPSGSAWRCSRWLYSVLEFCFRCFSRARSSGHCGIWRARR